MGQSQPGAHILRTTNTITYGQTLIGVLPTGGRYGDSHTRTNSLLFRALLCPLLCSANSTPLSCFLGSYPEQSTGGTFQNSGSLSSKSVCQDALSSHTQSGDWQALQQPWLIPFDTFPRFDKAVLPLYENSDGRGSTRSVSSGAESQEHSGAESQEHSMQWLLGCERLVL